jgi:hypothetical protein
MQTAADASPAVLLAATELSKSKWRVATTEPGSPRVSHHYLRDGNAAGLLTLGVPARRCSCRRRRCPRSRRR